MLRSLYSGVSGMRNLQTKMDVISNNIANVNTTAFKSGRVRFQDMMSQTIANAQSPTTNGLGGINPHQIGLGVQVGAIDTIMTGGPLQPTGRDLDFAIEGEGFFILSEDSAGQLKSYTRDGVFYTDYEGNLVNGSGLRVLGYAVDSNATNNKYKTLEDLNKLTDTQREAYLTGNDDLKPLSIPEEIEVGGKKLELESFAIDGTGQIIGVYDDGNTYLLGQVAVSTFTNPEGLTKVGGNNYKDSTNSGIPVNGKAGEAGFGYVRQGVVEASNVDLANEFTEMIVTSRAYQANSRSITTSDEMLQELINLKR